MNPAPKLFTMSAPIPVLVPVLALALLVSACGSDGSAGTEAESPLAEFLGEETFGFGFDIDIDDPATQARLAQDEQERQERVVACMSEQGFEYIPQEQSSFDFASFNDGLDYDSREYAEKYGFGITTQHFPQETVGPDLVGYDDSVFDDIADQDANQEIVDSMDTATQDAYYEALYGAEPELEFDFDPETATDEELEQMEDAFAMAPQGCFGEAYDSGRLNQFYNTFEDEIEAMYEAIEADPRIVEANQDIEDCVADSGYEFSMANGGYGDIYDRFAPRLDEVNAESSGFGFDNLTEEDFETMSEDELEAMFNMAPELSDRGKQLLAELQDEETTIAVAVWDCGGSFGNDEMRNLFQEVSVEYEERFIDENADRLEEFRS